jgi:conjugative transfer signal peptidase TraF
MLRPSGVTDAPPARRVRGRRSSLVLGVLVLTAVVSTRWVRLNLSPSLPVGLYRLTAVPAEVTRGTLVVLPVPTRVLHVWSSWIPLLKPVAGVPGDVVCAQEGRVAVNGSDYGPIYLESHDRPLPYLETGCRPVPAGMVFLASQAPKSLDGRYFGMIPVERLTATATPLLLWR